MRHDPRAEPSVASLDHRSLLRIGSCSPADLHNVPSQTCGDRQFFVARLQFWEMEYTTLQTTPVDRERRLKDRADSNRCRWQVEQQSPANVFQNDHFHQHQPAERERGTAGPFSVAEYSKFPDLYSSQNPGETHYWPHAGDELQELKGISKPPMAPVFHQKFSDNCFP